MDNFDPYDFDSWVPLSQAAKFSSHDSEYLSLLARRGKLTSKKIDGVWHTTRRFVGKYVAEQGLKQEEHKARLRKLLSSKTEAEDARAAVTEAPQKTLFRLGNTFLPLQTFSFSKYVIAVALVAVLGLGFAMKSPLSQVALQEAQDLTHIFSATRSTSLVAAADGWGSDIFGNLVRGVTSLFASHTNSTSPFSTASPSLVFPFSNPTNQAPAPRAVTIATTTIIQNYYQTISGVSAAEHLSSLNALEQKLSNKFTALISNLSVSSAPAPAPIPVSFYQAISSIGNLSNGTISNSTISGGSISGASFSGTSVTGDFGSFTTLTGGATSLGTLSAATTTLSGGLVVSASATSTFTNGISISAGCISVNGTCLGSGSGSVSSGTAGQVAFYQSAGTSLTATSTLFLSSSQLVGIGTSSPLSVLDVYGDFTLSGAGRYLNFGDTAGTNGYGIRDSSGTIQFKNSGGSWAAFGVGGGSGGSFSTTTSSVSGELVNFANNTTDILAIGGSSTTTAKYWLDPNTLVSFFTGSVGIGTTSPGSALSVQGIANFSAATSTFQSSGGINLTSGCFAINGTCVGGGTYTFSYPLQNSGNTISLAFGTSTSNTWGGTQTFTNVPVLASLSGLVGANSGSLYQIATSTNFVTSLVAGNGISLSGGTGAVTVTNAYGYPFTQDTNFGQNAESTSTALWLKGTPFSLFASSTAQFSNASTTLFTNSGSTYLTALTLGALGVDSSGKVYTSATSTLSTISGSLALTQLAIQAAGTVIANGTGGNAAPTAISTSTLYGTAIGGQILSWVNGVPNWVGTTTAGTGLTYNAGSPGNFSVNSSQSIATLSNLTQNGFVFTSGGGGTLNASSFSANTIPYVNGAGTSIAYIATSSLSAGTGVTFSGTAGALMGGTALTLNTPWTISGNNIYNNNTGYVGIGTSTPYSPLSVWGGTTGNILEAVTSASSSVLTVSGTGFGTTTVTGLTISGSATTTSNVGFNITAGCYGINGSCLSLSNLSGTVSITNGGTGLTSLTANAILYANDAGTAFAQVATSSLNLAVTGGGTGLTALTTGDFLYGSNTNTLSALAMSTKGFILANVNGLPAWVATSSINNGVTSVQQTYGVVQTGAITLATTTAISFNGLTLGNTITNSSGTFTFANTLSGTLTVAGGGTGTTTAPVSQLLYGGASGVYQSVATTSVSCSGSTTCTAFTIIGNSPITISSTAGGGSGGGTWATTTSSVSSEYVNYPLNNTDIVAIGASATTTAKYFFDPNVSLAYLSGTIGIATSSPFAKFSVAGSDTVTTLIGADALTSFSGKLIDLKVASTTKFSVDQSGALSLGTALTVGNGGTGASSFPYGLVLSPGGTTALTNIATSSLGLLTTDVAEGTNKYYLDSRVNTYIDASTTIPKTYTANTFTNTNTFSILPILASLSGLVGANSGSLYQIATSTNFVTSLVAGNGISLSSGTGAVTVTNSYGFPFTQDTNFSQNAESTTTPLWLKGTPFSLFASSTAEFSNASTTLFTNSGSTYLTALTLGALGVDSSGKVYTSATSTLSTISGTLSAAQGGTGKDTSAYSGMLGINTGTYYQAATTTFSTGLTYSGGSVSVNSSQSIATLSNLTNNGFVFTSGGGGTLNASSFSANTIPYVNGAGTSIAYIATSSLNIGGTAAGLSATLAVGSGGTGLSSLTANNILYANDAGTGFAQIATSSLNLGISGGGTATTTFYNGGLTFYNSTLGTLSQAGDGIGLFWDEINKRLGIGTSSPFAGPFTVESGANTTNTFLTGSVDNFLQLNIQNRNAGTSASSDLVATNNIGTNNPSTGGTYYVDLGINSSAYNQAAYNINGVNGAYLYASDAALAIGTASTTNTNAVLQFFTGGTVASNERARITQAGLVGVGTTSPYARLAIHANSNDTLNTTLFAIASSTATATTTLFSVSNSGLTSIGDSSGTGDAVFQFAADTNAWAIGYKSSDKSFNIASSTNLTGTAAVSVAKNGNTTIAGSGTTCVIGSGTGATSCTSDSRLKTNIEYMSGIDALAKLLHINAITFNWADPARDQGQQLGIIAQDVLQSFPQLVGSTTVNFKGTLGTYYTVDYAGLTAPLISAVNELNFDLGAIGSTTASSTPSSQSFASTFFSNLFARITSWFADAANGIGEFFAGSVHTKELCVSDEAGSETCITKSQLDTLIANAASASSPASSGTATTGGSGQTAGTSSTSTSTSTSPSDTEAPVITINGNNPATIAVGDTYVDLGAIVTDNVDTNLGLTASLDGGAAADPSALSIDTSIAGTHTIIYSATDTAGNTGTATRTVMVEDPHAAASTDVTATSTTP